MKKINTFSKHVLSGLLAIVMLTTLSACNRSGASLNASATQSQANSSTTDSSRPAEQSQTRATDGDASASSGKGEVLIVYFAVAENSAVDAVASASVTMDKDEAKGLVRVLAEDIQAVVGGDLFSIKTSVDYPGRINELIDYAADEQDRKDRPELTAKIENLDDYDTVFIGYPNWWYDMPMVMYSFFEEHDFSGKTIIPFNSHNGSRFSSTINTIQELEPNATVIKDGFTVNQSDVTKAADDIADWLGKLDY